MTDKTEFISLLAEFKANTKRIMELEEHITDLTEDETNYYYWLRGRNNEIKDIINIKEVKEAE